jgi:hypothetical protein
MEYPVNSRAGEREKWRFIGVVSGRVSAHGNSDFVARRNKHRIGNIECAPVHERLNGSEPGAIRTNNVEGLAKNAPGQQQYEDSDTSRVSISHGFRVAAHDHIGKSSSKKVAGVLVFSSRGFFYLSEKHPGSSDPRRSLLHERTGRGGVGF